jgi:DNA-binding NtrC family response regulator
VFGKKPIKEVARPVPFDELQKRTRIVVIDDKEDEFPFHVLKKQGYAIDYWPDVTDVEKLERGFYDIIILDIGGVGAELDSDNEGVGILRHIKTVNPAQIVVAYSGQSHESRRIPFFKLADQYVPKPTNAITWKETLDDLIRTKVTVDYYWDSLRALLQAQGVDQKRLDRLEKGLIAASKSGTTNAGELVSKTLVPHQSFTVG